VKEFLAQREELKRSRPELIDRAELNLYRSLGPRFSVIAPSTHREAPYRCHLAERFLAHLELPAGWKARTLVSHGVRRSLRALFGLVQRVAIPSDVYPVYLQLASEAGVQVVPYESTLELGLREDCDSVLICEPSKPWGTALTDQQTDALITWARNGKLIIIDSAYATPPTKNALRLLESGHAALLCSLSKGWLIPDHGGICIVPEDWMSRARAAFAALPKDEAKLRIAYAALTEFPNRPREVTASLSAAAKELDAWTLQRPELKLNPCVGYFAVSERSFEELLALGVLGVPAAVFGSTRARCVVTPLCPAGGEGERWRSH
jgi:histidinol-phosphate/aromatic aminotransferase/cobyric acid decarboxylase-like protein